MSYERPAWAQQEPMQNLPQFKAVNIDVGEFIRTRDALTSAYLGLSASLDRAVKAYLDHTQVVLHGDASLNVSTLLQPFNVLTNHAQMAQMALQQGNGGAPLPLVPNGAVAEEEPENGKKKRKKRAYKQRDPNAPKRPLTAYFRFLGENRATIGKEIHDNPAQFEASGKPGDISRIATDRWNALTKDQQEPYRAAYQAALKEYEKEVERYKATGGKPEDLDETKVDESLVQMGAGAAIAKVDEDDDDDDDDEDEEEDVAPPPPPPPAVKSPKKSALKKSKAGDVAQPPVFSSSNLAITAPAPAPPAASSSPDRKRKAGAETEGGAKKRGRKSGADVVAAADPQAPPPPAPIAAMASSPEVEQGSKKKKDKKKDKKKSGDA